MALPVLDGNQTATTLSSVVTGGEHIVAHSVVSLGATAIANITSAVSGSVVSVSNLPSTQTIAGTVTANGGDFASKDTSQPASAVQIGFFNLGGDFQAVNQDGASFPIRVQEVDSNVSVAISGTVTVANFPSSFIIQDAQNNQAAVNEGTGALFVEQVGSVTIGSLPAISGTVTAAAPNGSLTARFGTPTTANVSFATSAVTNANRKYLLIQNVTTGSNVITVGIGFTPTTTQGIQLTAGAGITFESSYIPTGAVYVLSSVTASNFTILEA